MEPSQVQASSDPYEEQLSPLLSCFDPTKLATAATKKNITGACQILHIWDNAWLCRSIITAAPTNSERTIDSWFSQTIAPL